MMRMTTGRLLVLRLYNVTLGRCAWGDALLRQTLVKLLVKKQDPKRRYTASARCFDMRQLNP